MTLSERGIMVRMAEPLSQGAKVEVELKLSDGQIVRVGGEVIYVRGKGIQGAVAGVTIKFDRVTLKDSERLQALVTQLLIGDIVATQVEPVIKPG